MVVLRPADPLTPTIAKVSARGSTISVLFPEIVDKFNSFVKDRGYRWSRPVWMRQIAERAGTVEDRTVELGCHLLALGFCVELPNEALAERVRNGEYEPEHTRWVLRRTSGKYTDWFAIEWSRQEDYYTEAKRLRGARYDPPHVVVPATSYEEILDFADANGFRLSPGAQGLATEARTRFEQAMIVAPLIKKRDEPTAPQVVAIGIANELKDEPL